jgi:putative oxidoreductase
MFTSTPQGAYFSRLNMIPVYLIPLLDLFLRLWIAYIFFNSGLIKVQSWETTLGLFEREYQVPFLSPFFAALLATAIELILPLLLVLGLSTRLAALILFVFNAMAIYAHQAYLYDVGYANLVAHFYWGLLLLIVLIQGANKLSLDYMLNTHTGWCSLDGEHPVENLLVGILGMLLSLLFLTNFPSLWGSLAVWEALQWQNNWDTGLIGYLGILVSMGFVVYRLSR